MLYQGVTSMVWNEPFSTVLVVSTIEAVVGIVDVVDLHTDDNGCTLVIFGKLPKVLVA
jgi:hypothetical protein